MYQVVYNNKLEHKCTLTPLYPRLLYVGPIQGKGHLSFRDTYTDSYSYKGPLPVLFVLCLAAFSNAGHLSVLYSIWQLLIRIMQYWADCNANYSAYHIEYIVFILFINHVYQKNVVSWLLQAIRLFFFFSLCTKNLRKYNFLNIYPIEIK